MTPSILDNLDDITRRAILWMVGHDTGVSSGDMWHALTGIPRSSPFPPSTPLDSDDFSRCYRLIQAIPEWRDRLDVVARLSPEWAAIVERWDELCATYEARPDPRNHWVPEVNAIIDECSGRAPRRARLPTPPAGEGE